jgi:hypothetical protein
MQDLYVTNNKTLLKDIQEGYEDREVSCVRALEDLTS